MFNEISVLRRGLCGVFAFTVGACLVLASAVSASEEVADHARQSRPLGYVCYLAESQLAIDGRLDEPAWKSSAWTADFVDIEGSVKPLPRFRTRAKMLWDAQYFYIGVLLEEPHVWGTLVKHDSVIFHDNDFEVFIDPNGDNHEYYEFEINALNTGWDLFLSRPYMDKGVADNSWEIPGLRTGVDVQGTLNDPTDEDLAWSVELAIPWSALREFAHRSCPPKSGDQWRVNFSRVEWQHEITGNAYRKVPNTPENNWVWSPQGIINMHRPDRWGFVQFSDAAVGSDSLKPNPSWEARVLLMSIYERQKEFHEKQQRYSIDMAELLGDQQNGSLKATIRLTDAGFSAKVSAPHPDGTTRQLEIRQDSLLQWIDTE